MAYGTDTSFLDYLALSGRTLPAGKSPAVARYWGSVYVDMWEDRYHGKALNPPASFPRDKYDPVPVAVENATYEAGLAWADGINLFGTGGTEGGQVIREKVDVLEVQYAEPQGGGLGYWDNNRFIYPLAYMLLLPFMRKASGCIGAFIANGRC